MQDGARLVPVQPEVHGEAARQEHGVHRARHHLLEGHQLVGHVVVYLAAVQLRRDDDVVAAHVARHDVLVELDGHLVAVAQYAVGRRGRVEVDGPLAVLDDGSDVAIRVYHLRAVGRGGEGAELVVALGIGQVARHVERQAQVARLGQQLVAQAVAANRVVLVHPPRVQVGPLRAALEAVLHAHVPEVLELAVEALQPHLQLSAGRVAVHHRLVDGQLHGRRRRHEVYVQLALVVDFGRLIRRFKPQYDAFVVEHALVGLAHGDDLLHRLAGGYHHAASVGRHTVHQHL